MTQFEDISRRCDGSIDFDFYRRQASQSRRRVRRLVFARILKLARDAANAVSTFGQFATFLEGRSQRRVTCGIAAALILAAAITAATANSMTLSEPPAVHAPEVSRETADANFHFGIGG